MRKWSGAALALLLFYSIAVLWLPNRWAWTAFQLGIFALAAVWLVAMPLRGSDFAWSPVLIPPAFAIALGSVQLLSGRTVYEWKTCLAILDWTTFLAAGFVALQVFSDPELRHQFLRAVAWFALVLSAIAVTQLFTSHGKVYWLFASGYKDYVLGPFVYRNQYSAFIELLLPVVLWQALVDRPRSLLYWVTAGVMHASVIAAASRAGSILVSVELLVFLLLALALGHLDLPDAGRALAKVLILAAVFIAVVGWDLLWNRLRQPDPFAGRREILSSSVEMVRARPLWGFGLGAWPVAYPRYAVFDDGTYVNQAHDDWLQWASEGGLPLLLSMAWLAAMVFRPAVRSLWGLGILFELVHSTVDYPLQQRPALAAWFFIFVAMAVQADRQRRISPSGRTAPNSAATPAAAAEPPPPSPVSVPVPAQSATAS